MPVPKLTPATQIVLQLFVDDPERELYGRELAEVTRLAVGTVHPILDHLRSLGWLTQRREDPTPTSVGRPRRLYHRLHPDIVKTGMVEELKTELASQREQVEARRKARAKRLPRPGTAKRSELARMRVEHGHTQASLAALIGVTGPRISQIENRAIRATEVGTLQRFFAGLGGRLRLTVEFEEHTVELAAGRPATAIPGVDIPPE